MNDIAGNHIEILKSLINARDSSFMQILNLSKTALDSNIPVN